MQSECEVNTCEHVCLQKDRDVRKLEHHELKESFDLTVKQRDWYLADNMEQKLLIQSLQDELGEEAEFDEEDDPKTRRIWSECGKRVGQYEERMHQLESGMQKKVDKQVELLQRGAITIVNEQKRNESNFQRLQSEVHRANNAVDKMRDEAVRLRSKNNDLRKNNERSSLERQLESENSECRTALEERDSAIANLWSLLERRNQELDGLDPPTSGSYSQGTRSQSSQRAGWQSDCPDSQHWFQGYFLPTNTQVLYDKGPEAHKDDFGEHGGSPSDQLLRHEAFDDSVLGNLIDNETISLLQYIFAPTETPLRHPIISHSTVDWDVATIIEALE